MQGTHTAQQQPGLKRSHDHAMTGPYATDIAPEIISLGSNKGTAEHIAVPVQVFRRRMHDQIRAVLNGSGQNRAGRSGIDAQSGTDTVCQLREPGNIEAIP